MHVIDNTFLRTVRRQPNELNYDGMQVFGCVCTSVLKFSKKNVLSAEFEGTVFATDIQPQYRAKDDVDGRQSHGGARGNRGRYYGLGRIFSRRDAGTTCTTVPPPARTCVPTRNLC